MGLEGTEKAQKWRPDVCPVLVPQYLCNGLEEDMAMREVGGWASALNAPNLPALIPLALPAPSTFPAKLKSHMKSRRLPTNVRKWSASLLQAERCSSSTSCCPN